MNSFQGSQDQKKYKKIISYKAYQNNGSNLENKVIKPVHHRTSTLGDVSEISSSQVKT